MQKVVILDPGHGGINPSTGQYVTPGKRSPIWKDGSVYYEGVGNRHIVELAGRILAARGVKVLYTVSPNDWQDVSLSKRVKIANDHYRQNPTAFLISVHSNASDNPQANGYEVFTSPGQTKSDAIATLWFKEHGKLFPALKGRPDNKDGDVDKEEKFTIINDTRCPAILIETMFHTNEKECKILQSTCGVRDVATAIVNTIMAC
jgi:N-acetylmuramoyl-L-alanine amidase